MAEHIAIPAGVNPNAAIPAGAEVTQHSTANAPGAPAGPTVPALPAASEQRPGFAPAAAPSGDEAAEFAAFQAWKKAQATPATPVVPVTPPKPASQSNRTSGFEIGAESALNQAQTAAQSDPYLMSTFSMFEMVAPDVDLARALGNAIDRGDISLIDTKYITEKGGEKAEKLIEVAKGLVQHVTKTVENLTSNIYSKAGGEAQWDAAVAVFNNEAPKYLKEFVASSIDSANPQKIESAVEALLDFTRKSGKLPVAPKGHVHAGGGAPNASLALSKEGYQAERLKLDRRARDFSDRERELTARRQLGKQMGL